MQCWFGQGGVIEPFTRCSLVELAWEMKHCIGTRVLEWCHQAEMAVEGGGVLEVGEGGLERGQREGTWTVLCGMRVGPVWQQGAVDGLGSVNILVARRTARGSVQTWGNV